MPSVRTLLIVLTASAMLVLAGCGLAERDDEGNLVESGSVGAHELRVGDCYDDGEGQDPGETFEVFDVDAVPCDEPHDNEVYALWDLPDGDFPGDDAVVDQAFGGCIDRFAAFAGVPYERTTLDIGIFYPLADAWADGDREVVCAVYDPEGPVTGSLAGAGADHGLAGLGECMDDLGFAVDCAEEHYAEVYIETMLPGEEFPGTTAIEDQTVALCVDGFADFVGTEWNASALDFVYLTPDEESWAAGDREVICAVYDPAGPLTGTAEGAAR